MNTCAGDSFLIKFLACSDKGIFLSVLQIFNSSFFTEDLQLLLLLNVPKLKEKKERANTIQKWIKNKAKHQLKTTLIISNINGRKNVNVIGKDLVSWVARKQSLTKKIAVFCWNIFSENTAKLVIDNVVCEKL